MRKDYNKLIRDRIPEIIRAEQRECATETMSEDDYRNALLEKLIEEAQEVAVAAPEKLLTELADLQEVFDSILALQGISLEEVKREQHKRRHDRGGFEKRLRLLWTE